MYSTVAVSFKNGKKEALGAKGAVTGAADAPNTASHIKVRFEASNALSDRPLNQITKTKPSKKTLKSKEKVKQNEPKPALTTAQKRGLSIQLHEAAKKGETAKVLSLIKQGGDKEWRPNDRHQMTALHYASSNGHPDTVRALIKAGAKVNAKDATGYTALVWASSLAIVKILVEEGGADMDVIVHQLGTALHIAGNGNKREIASYLRNMGARDAYNQWG